MSNLLISPLSQDSLDIESIKTVIKQDLIDNDVITDINYDGSNISVLVQIMSYMVYNINASHAMNANQTTLLLSEIRQNIIYLSQQIGYNITRPVSSKMSISFSIDGLDDGDTLTIPSQTVFTCGDYEFISQEDIELTTSLLEDTTSIIEGTYIDYTVDPDLRFSPESETNKFLINYTNIENDNLFIRIKRSNESEFSDHYDSVPDLLSLKSSTFYSEMDPESRFVYVYTNFVGNGLTIVDDDTVDVSFILSSGSDANGIVDCEFSETDTFTTTLGSEVAVTINVESASSGGSDEESSDSIKQNAPLFYNTGNRTVNRDDYISFLIKNSLIDYATVWGGDSIVPKNLGHTYISFIPQNEARFLTIYEQSQILKYLSDSHIIAIGLKLVRPSYIEVDYNINVLGELALIETKKTQISTALTSYFSDLIGFNSYYFENKAMKEVEDLFISNTKASVKVSNSFHLNVYAEQFTNFLVDGKVEYYIPNSTRRGYLVQDGNRIEIPQDNRDLYNYLINGWEEVIEPDILYDITFSGTVGTGLITTGSTSSIILDGTSYTKKDMLSDGFSIGYYVVELNKLIITTNISSSIVDGDRINILYDDEINVVCEKNQILELGNIIFS